jgi:hypothetical protein
LKLRRDLLDEGVVRKARKLLEVELQMVIVQKIVRGKNSRALSRAAFLQLYLDYDRFARVIHRDGVLETVQNLIRRVLEPSVRLVQLARRLRGELTEFITVTHVRESTKDKIRAHSFSFSI